MSSDWLVLTAALLGVGVLTVAAVGDGMSITGDTISDYMDGMDVSIDTLAVSWADYTPRNWTQETFETHVAAYMGNSVESITSDAQGFARSLEINLDAGHTLPEASTASRIDILASRLHILETRGDPMPENYDEILAILNRAGAL